MHSSKWGGALVALTGIFLTASTVRAQDTLTFDDMPGAVIDGNVNFEFVNGGSTVYHGITWDDRLRVFGDQYKVGSTSEEPYYGVPHSGNYALSNTDGTDGVYITTDRVLLSAWFGQNEFYGFGGGADQVTITAMSGDFILNSLVFDLPDNNPGQPEPLSFFDTSAFQSLTNITGYRIDRNALGEFGGNWVADDFTFGASSTVVPEAGSLPLALSGIGVLGMVAGVGHRRRETSTGR